MLVIVLDTSSVSNLTLGEDFPFNSCMASQPHEGYHQPSLAEECSRHPVLVSTGRSVLATLARDIRR